MRNILRAVIPFFILLGFSTLQAQVGCPAVTTATNVTVPCGQTCTNLYATAFGGAVTTSYVVNQIAYAPPFAFNSGTAILVNTDDIWSSTIPLPFNFCFYGNTYNSAVIGSNGVISFNTANAGAFNNWSIPAGGAPFTTEADMRNCIMAPWQDLDPTNGGNVFYNVGGTAPCRYLEVSWYHCPMYGDPNSVNTAYCTTSYQQTQMAVIYETSNSVEIYIQQKGAACTGWNSGWAVEGLMNAAGTAAITVPGRNASTWAANNDAWSFTAAGAPNYTITWFQGVTQIGTGSPIQVCPTGPATYTASATYTNCDNSTVTVTSNVFVGLGGLSVTDSSRQISCNNANDGAVYAIFHSNSGVISYGWAPGGAGQTSLNNIGPGTYIFTISDSSGCSQSDTIVLANPAPVLVSVPNDTAPSCTPTTNNGALTATASGGTPSYTYLWTGGATINPITGLNVGSYSVTATDNHGCSGTASASVSVQTNPIIFLTPQITNVSCLGGSNGQIVDPINGGTSPITYNWSVGTGHTDTLANLGAGTYTVTAVDANGCSATASFTIAQPATAVAVTVANDTVVSCSGSTNIGTLTASASGGTAGYTYLWSNGATTATISNLGAATYTVTITDANGCTVSGSGTVVIKTSSLGITGVVTNASCVGIKGQIIVTVTGATQPITYVWSTGSSTTDTLSNIGGGTYSVTATDANGCSISASYTVAQPAPLIVTVPNDTIVTCSVNTTIGALTASASGGTPAYSYAWTGSLSGNPITGLSVGAYVVTVTDGAGCTATGSGSVVLTSNPVVFNTPQIINATCAGSGNGEIILNTSGGTQPVTFTWSGGTTQNDTLLNLAGGTYNITAVDANGCSATASYTISQPSPIVFGTPVITNVGCTGGNNGSISVTATGGTGTITYAWSNLATTMPLTGLGAGSYTVTATDANGCTAKATYTVGQNAPIAIGTATVDGVSCSGNGSISVTATGGTGTLTYAWTGGLTGANITNLAAAGYTLTVTDANGCSATAYYIVGHSSCGGCPAVNTNNNVAIPCSQTCTNLIASAFSAAQTTAYTVGQIGYNPPFPFNTGTPVLVAVDDKWSGIINLPFNFCFWGVVHNQIVIGSNGEVSFNTGNANAFENWSIPGPLPFATEPDQRNTIMAPWQDLDPTYHGSIHYNITGTAPCRKFEVAWDNVPMFGDSGSVDNAYCDSTDHQSQMIVLYETTNAIDIYIANKDIVCTDLSGGTYWNGGLAIEGIVNPAGTANVTVPGRNATQWSAHNDAWRFTPAGAPNFTVAWYQGANLIGTTDTINVCPNVPTTYSVFATYTNCDNSQIVVGDSVYVTPGGSLTVNIDSTHNPLCNGDSTGSVYASYRDSASNVVSFGWSPGGANQTSLVNIPAGTYIFTVTTTSGCTKSDTVVLVNPTKVSVSLPNDTFSSCTANNIGTLTAGASGGTPGYTYSWSNGATTATISGLTPGTYSVTVTDSHGCTASATALVVKISGNLTLTTPIVVNPTCSVSGSITQGVTGGTLPIIYTWSPTEPNTGTLTGLSAGTWLLTVTDAGGCSATATFTLTNPSTVVIDSSHVTNVTCNGANNGTITVYASGGAPPLTYTWTPTLGNISAATGLAAGTYSVTVSDRFGCSASASYTITQPSAITPDTVSVVDVTCVASGSIFVIDTGGVGALTYAWSTGQTTNSLSNLQAGTYVLTVTDATGCSVTASYTVGTAPGALVFGTPVIVNTTCNGDSTGSITVNATGGNGTITYLWSNGATTTTISGLAAGTYTVTASTNGCSASASYTVTQPTAVTLAEPVITNVSCNGGSDGSINASASGGTGAISFLWSNGSTGALVSGLAVGQYCVTATDSVGCSVSACYNITQPTPLVVDSSTTTQITCVASGSIHVYVSGGTGVYTYNWSNGQTVNPVSVTAAGTTYVTVTDANGCSVVDSFTVIAGVGAVTIGTPVITNVTCNGGNDGSITVVASDSAGGPITFVWSNQATTATITGLSAGITYTVTATDSAGCSATASYVVTQPNAVTFGNPVFVSPSCNGSNNGSITANATGGTGTITYTWPGVTGATDTALVAGTYTVTATDSVGCSATASYTLTQPTAVVFGNPVITNVTCNGNSDGGITASASGGTGTITYAWGNQSTGASITGLVAGQYCVTATDSAGCTATACYTVTQPAPLIIDTAVITQATCTVGGTIVVTVSGGTGPYTYGWSSSSSTTDSAGGLAGGPITVTITDHNGCSITATYNIPAAPNTVVIDSAIITNVTCNAGSNGSISVVAGGGVGTLTYHWGTNPGTTAAISGLTAGTYAVTVTDSLGCSASAQYTVTQPAAIVIDSVVSKQVTCTSQGSLQVFAHGGTGAFTYTWQGSAYTGDSLGGLAAGTYGITVTDANGCSVTATGTVTTAPNSISLANNTIVQPTCFGLSNGSITVVPTGGSGGYVFNWSNQATSGTITGLAAGTYCLTVHDSNGCSQTVCDTVGQPAVLAISNFITTNATCNTLGSMQVVATGGTVAYTYLWTGGTTANPITNLIGGTAETVTVTDHNGCTVSGSDTLAPAPAPLTFSEPNIVNVLCYNGATGSIAVSTFGGSGGIVVFHWSNNGSTATITGLTAGTYYVTAADAGGCVATDSFNITQPAPYFATITAKPLVCPGTVDTGFVTVTGGVSGFTYLWSDGETTQLVTNLPANGTGISVVVTDATGCTTLAGDTVRSAAQIAARDTVVATPCSNLGGGNLIITATGGTGILTYTYTPQGSTNNTGVFNNVAAGSYGFTVTDTLGCFVNGQFHVNPPAPADVYTSKADSANCFGFSDGSITVTEDSLRNGPFTYSLNGGAFGSSNVFDSLAAGTYHIVVRNNYGCTDTLLDTVGQPAQLTVSFSPDTIIGVANYANTLNPTIVNFINPVFSWTPATGLSCTNCANPTATVSAPSLYYVTVSDSLNSKCAVTDSVWLLLKGPLVMPDAFSPNGDGKNDFFGPVSHTYVVVKEFHIYNRWGQLVHNSTEPWDGKFNGKEQPSGTYMYYIEGQYFDPATNSMQTGKEEGGVTLLR